MLNKIVFSIAAVAVTVMLIPAVTKEKSVLDTPQVLGTQTEKIEEKQENFFIKSSPELAENLELPVLTAKAALAFDLDSGAILYTKNFDQELPVASLTKLMTALVVVENLDLNQEVVIEKKDTEIIGSKMGLVPGEKIKVVDLLHGMLIASSNDAAQALARHTAGSSAEFVVLMNAKSSELELASSHFSNPVGLDSVDNYSTTFDMGKVVSEFIRVPELARIVQIKQLKVSSIDQKFSHVLTSTNKLLLEDPGILGIKTGYTDEAMGNLIVRKKQADAEVVTIVLGSDDRENDTRLLLAWVLGSYKW